MTIANRDEKREQVTTAMAARHKKKWDHHPRKPDPVSRERFIERTITASRAVYRRLSSLLLIIPTALQLIRCSCISNIETSKAAECVMNGNVLLSADSSLSNS
jgi:hypothetical protein